MDQNNNMIVNQLNSTQDPRNTVNMDSVQEVSSLASLARAVTQESRPSGSRPMDSETCPLEMEDDQSKLKERRDLINFRHRDLNRRHRVLFDKLRVRLPVRPSCYVTKERTLDMALDYINYLESLLGIKSTSQGRTAALAHPPGRRMDTGVMPPPAGALPEKDPKPKDTAVKSRPLYSMIPGAPHRSETFNQGFIDMSRQRRHSEVALRRQLFNDTDHWSMERPQSTSTPISFANQSVFPGPSPLATRVHTGSLSGSSGYHSSNSQGSIAGHRLNSADSQSSLVSTNDDDDDVFGFSDKPHQMVWPEQRTGSGRVNFHSNPPRHHSTI